MEPITDHRWTVKQFAIELIVLIAGGVLGIFWPVWFAPPNASMTFWLYLCLLLLWLPVLIILVIGHYRKAASTFLILVAAGVVMTMIILGLQGANFSAWAIQNKDCTSSEVSPGQTEYVCTVVALSGRRVFTLQGPTGSPFVRLLSNRFIGSF